MSIIKNFGLRWVRERVEWGAGGNAGSLMGKAVGAKRSVSIDFRNQIGIYVLFEAGFDPVYIGQAGFGNADLFDRLKHHKKDHLRDRWTHFSWFGFRAVNADGSLSAKNRPTARTSITYVAALDEVEGVLIHVLEPRLNKQGAKWKKHAREYVQAGRPPEADRLTDLVQKVDELLERTPKRDRRRRG